MLISASETASARRAIDEVVLSKSNKAQSAAQSAESWKAGSQLSGRYAAAFSILGIDHRNIELIDIPATKPSPAGGSKAEDEFSKAFGPEFEQLRDDFEKALVVARKQIEDQIVEVAAVRGLSPSDPSLAYSEDNVAHNARVMTIMANRDMFPPGEFSITTEFAEGGSVSSLIPATAPRNLQTFLSLKASITQIDLKMSGSDTGISVSVASLELSYAEWN